MKLPFDDQEISHPTVVLLVGLPDEEGHTAAKITLLNTDGSKPDKFQPWMLESLNAAHEILDKAMELIKNEALQRLLEQDRQQRKSVLEAKHKHGFTMPYREKSGPEEPEKGN